MSIKTKIFNPFDYMETQAEVNAYLTECFKDENPNIFINALGHLVRKHGVASVANSIGVNRESLYKSFNGTTVPRWDTVRNIMTLLQVDVTAMS